MNIRSFESSEFHAERNGNEMTIEGYFSVFDKPYTISSDAFETVDRHAFDKTLDGDIRALVNHDSSLVLGRTLNNTLELRVDEVGLFGVIHINPNDTDAVNCYERVKRGDVSQCSFGFEILEEKTEFLENNSVHWTLMDVRLHEVSVCTFPAYPDTSVSARSAEAEKIRGLREWKMQMVNSIKEA